MASFSSSSSDTLSSSPIAITISSKGSNGFSSSSDRPAGPDFIDHASIFGGDGAVVIVVMM